MRVIETAADLAEGAAHLAAACPIWAKMLPQIGPLPLRRQPGGFGALRDAVVSQQLSVASAAAIGRKLAAAGLDGAPAILSASDEALRACGLSAQKIRYLRGIATADLDFDALALMPDEQAIAVLTALPGIGRWTAEIYLMFALGRADAFCPDDLALQEAVRMLYGLPERPRGRALADMARPWQPWRSVAARGLWAYYRIAKGREGIA
ncbi:DNA-3-methyladenine glycosylase family protein [Paracoccus contaminans]|uniref:DNA-3-methyladenine glycosylase II n=1 Tax=Paracoccus contaminans TaxID=1945662 RepID=A0A1W6CX40_9RHOB|nr:DNA-3-methyladenine glycosylase [Paracoccus contaminans]ARJ69437.1 3-methyladenine DNA glycosylase [Paracoccus contaminans]